MTRQDQHPPHPDTETVSPRILVSAGERLLQDTLARWGYEIVVASDGHQALRYLREKNPPKLAILNWEMERLRGPEVCQFLREGEIEPYIYIILLTNESRKDELLEALDHGADDYFHFKQVNDDYGHLVGDAVLREVAARLKGAARSYDTLGRCGGEEFLIILPGCDAATVLNRAEEIRASVSNEIIPMPEGNIQVTLSMGASATSATAQGDSISILKAADAALYRAKSQGRDRIELAK